MLKWNLEVQLSHPKIFNFGLCVENINKNKYFDIWIKFAMFSKSLCLYPAGLYLFL
jgi:hypothetical protein